MSKNFSKLRLGMPSKLQIRSKNKANQLLAEVPLHELRQARRLSQKMLAEVLKVQQTAIAKLEKRTDTYISTLRSHIEAMGGQLDIVAHFPEGSVQISNFSKLGNNEA